MAKLLHILSHPGGATSHTLRIANAFLESYREAHPEDEVSTLNLYTETVSFITADHLSAAMKQETPDAMTPSERQAWDEVMGHIRHFTVQDKYLVTAPMWNFSVPAILKAYIDQIVQAGQTFRYTEIGTSVGLLEGKRMAILSTRGGIYSQPPMANSEMCVRYLHAVFGFLGIEIVGEIVAEGLALVDNSVREEIISTAIDRARQMAQTL